MVVEDSKAPFLRVAWTSRLLSRPNTIIRVPTSRSSKHDTEDTLFAEILKTSRTIQSCICVYQKPRDDATMAEFTTLVDVGDGMDGHARILHGGITATLVDESMGMYQAVHQERAHMKNVKVGKADGELPPTGNSPFTAELKVRYLRPVRTPGTIAVSVRRVKREGRKEWLVAEVKQCVGQEDDSDAEVVVCATGEALFLYPRTSSL